MPHRNIHISRCVCFVFPSCGVVQLAYNESYGIEIDHPTGHPLLPNNFVSRVLQRVLTPACFRSTAHHTCHSNNEETVFCSIIASPPGEEQKTSNRSVWPVFFAKNNDARVPFFWEANGLWGGRNRAQHHSSLRTWILARFGAAVAAHIWLLTSNPLHRLDILGASQIPSTDWNMATYSVAVSSKNDVHESKPSQQLVQWIQFTPVLGK